MAEGGLVRRLFEGEVDIVADVHGESGPLLTLLDRMGYDGNGVHKEGRRLVFVGDLVDRGPDSVTVVNLVKKLVRKGMAMMVVGNHELNLLRESKKHGNHWWWGETEVIRMDKEAVSLQVFPPDDAWKQDTVAFFRSLPVALERDDLRVCHACWHEESIEKLRGFQGDALEAFRHFEAANAKNIEKLKGEGASEIALELAWQNGNPFNCVCSGMEEEAAQEYFAGGKWRKLDRSKWWERYSGPQLCVFGHYWRRFPKAEGAPDLKPSGEDPFTKYTGTQMLGPAKKAVCIDFSAGIRYEERGKNLPAGSLGTAMAILRHPEMTLHLDDGRILALEGGGMGEGAKEPEAKKCKVAA